MTTTERTRTVTWEDPMVGALRAHGMSGLEYLQRIQRGEIAAPPIAKLLGMDLLEVTEGHARFGLTVGEHLYNPIGSVHGGVFATLLDSVVGCAVHSTLPAGKGYTTLEIKVNMIKPLRVDSPPVTAVGSIVSVGSRVAIATGQIEDSEGRIYATASTTCLVFDAPG